jgi:hypothetical protein
MIYNGVLFGQKGEGKYVVCRKIGGNKEHDDKEIRETQKDKYLKFSFIHGTYI